MPLGTVFRPLRFVAKTGDAVLLHCVNPTNDLANNTRVRLWEILLRYGGGRLASAV